MKYIALLLIATASQAEELRDPLRRHPIEAVRSVYDGDTMTLDIGLGQSMFTRATIRLYGIDTPEIRPLKSRAAAKAARDFVVAWLDDCPAPEIVTGTDKDGQVQRGKYGRVLAHVLCGERDLASEMIQRGLGTAYFGGSKQGH